MLPRIVLLGESGVGKTALAMALMNGSFESDQASSTSGIEIPADGPFSIRDFSSRGPLSAPGTQELIGAHEVVVLLVNPAQKADEPLDASREWLGLLAASRPGHPRAKRFLVGTHGDLWTEAEAERFFDVAKKYRLDGAFRTSGRTKAGIEELRSSLQLAAEQHQDEPDKPKDPVALAIQDFAEKLCKLVAEDAGYLDKIEWRQLEQLIATALEAVGFSVELTAPSKDGGKDVIVWCSVEGRRMVYYVEIKHWRKNRPSLDDVVDFVEVNARDNTDGGLFLSSSGYTMATYQQVGKISQQRIRLGDREKIVSLCQHYASERGGILFPLTPLPELLFERTIE